MHTLSGAAASYPAPSPHAFNFLRYLPIAELRPIVRGNAPLPREAIPIWNQVLSDRLPALLESTPSWRIVRALAAQGEEPAGIFDLVRWSRFLIFLAWGALVHGPVGFSELIFDGADTQTRAAFSRELLK